ncbi:MAG: hypothetical protein AAF488_15330, partial [Planctomycetota bacterium]
MLADWVLRIVESQSESVLAVNGDGFELRAYSPQGQLTGSRSVQAEKISEGCANFTLFVALAILTPLSRLVRHKWRFASAAVLLVLSQAVFVGLSLLLMLESGYAQAGQPRYAESTMTALAGSLVV